MKIFGEMLKFFWKRLKKVVQKFRQKFGPVSEVLDPLVSGKATPPRHFSCASFATFMWLLIGLSSSYSVRRECRIWHRRPWDPILKPLHLLFWSIR